MVGPVVRVSENAFRYVCHSSPSTLDYHVIIELKNEAVWKVIDGFEDRNLYHSKEIEQLAIQIEEHFTKYPLTDGNAVRENFPTVTDGQQMEVISVNRINAECRYRTPKGEIIDLFAKENLQKFTTEDDKMPHFSSAGGL